MIRIFLLFLLLAKIPLYSTVDFNFEGEVTSDKPLIISLGSWCNIALEVRNAGFRNAAFPLDWIVSMNDDRLALMLDEDFEHFTDENYLIHKNAFTNDHTVVNTYYELECRHDWPFEDEEVNAERFAEQIQFMKSKYKRRINRFRSLKEYPGKVYFIRNPTWWSEYPLEWNADKARNLRDSLRNYFPKLNFTLVIINYPFQNAPILPEIEDVKHYLIERHEFEGVLKKLVELNE